MRVKRRSMKLRITSQKMRRLVLRLLVAIFAALQFGALLAVLLTAKVSAAALPVASAASEVNELSAEAAES